MSKILYLNTILYKGQISSGKRHILLFVKFSQKAIERATKLVKRAFGRKAEVAFIAFTGPFSPISFPSSFLGK